MSTMVQSWVGASARRCSGTMGKSWSKAQWSGALWKSEKLAMYWSAILSPRSRVSRGSRFLPRFSATRLRASFQKSDSTVARSSSPRMPSLNICRASSFLATASW